LVPQKPVAGVLQLREIAGGASDVGLEMTDKDRAMPFVAIAGALGSAAIVRWAYRTAKRINAELEAARLSRVSEPAGPKDIPTLRRDPATGAYRPG
jgi:K+-sensing histidine kinase KdpD